MGGNRALTQEEIDSMFRKPGTIAPEGDGAPQPYDFRRPDRIAKDQIRALHLLHENFARSLGSSLSAYLRAYVTVDVISVEQLSFSEFIHCLPSPTSIVTLGMKPYDGGALLEISPSLMFPVLEMMLGGTAKAGEKLEREITEIERSILEGPLRILLHDLRSAWLGVAPLDFSVASHETDPQLLRVLAPHEAMVAIGLGVRIGEISGMMNLAIPSIVVKMLRPKFDQQWSARRTIATAEEKTRLLRLIGPAVVRLEARLQAPPMKLAALLELTPGDVLELGRADRPADLMVNGQTKFRGKMVTSGRNRGVEINALQ